MKEYLAEFIGTAILILLGNGVVAGVVLRKSKASDAGWIVVTAGWGLAVAVAVYAIGRISGGHINPAVTIAQAVYNPDFGWAKVPGYIAAQMAGAIVGQGLVFVHYLKQWGATPDPAVKLAAHSTGPEVRSLGANLATEVIGTFVLVFGVMAIAANADEMTGKGIDLSQAFSTGLAPMLVGLLVFAIGLSLGGPTGYAINPARDLGPRVAHSLLPIPGKGASDWSYSWIPVVGPVIGGLLGGGAWAVAGF